jgi:hypothetical protein
VPNTCPNPTNARDCDDHGAPSHDDDDDDDDRSDNDLRARSSGRPVS